MLFLALHWTGGHTEEAELGPIEVVKTCTYLVVLFRNSCAVSLCSAYGRFHLCVYTYFVLV